MASSVWRDWTVKESDSNWSVANTDINTRIGWYSKTVTSGTSAGGATGFAEISDSDVSRSGQALAFPRIQGADVCRRIRAVGEGVTSGRTGNVCSEQ
jgi:hypothetical protein